MLYYPVGTLSGGTINKILGVTDTIQAKENTWSPSDISTYSAEFLWDSNDNMCVKHSAVVWETLNKLYLFILLFFILSTLANKAMKS